MKNPFRLKGLRGHFALAGCLALLAMAATQVRADPSLGVERHQDFTSAEWVTGFAFIDQTVDGWSVHNAAIPDPFWPERACIFPDAAGPYIETPQITTGVGRFYFRARNTFDADDNNTIILRVDVSTNDGETWESIGSVTNRYSAASPWKWHHFQLDDYVAQGNDNFIFRIVRHNQIGTANRRIGVADITVSPPPADVVMTERLLSPGYPSQNHPVTLRLNVEDVDPIHTPTSNRLVRAFYRWEGGQLLSTNMTEIAEDEYEVVIPTHPAGLMEYYFRCDFDGYHYVHTPTSTDEVKSPRFLANLNGEPQTRATVPSNDPDLAEWLRYRIRLFDSRHSALWLDAQPEGAVGEMILVRDNTWQAVIEVSTITNIVMRFEGLDAYEEDAESYLETPEYWADAFQSSTNPPLSGLAQLDPAARIEIDITYDGFLLFRFNPETLEYTVKRAVFQDFDDWQASLDRFEYSLGLYAVQTFAADFDAWTPDVVGPGQRATENFRFEPGTDADYQPYILSQNFWEAIQGRRVQERNEAPGTEIRNIAMMLQPSSAARFGNTAPDSMINGLEKITFRYRSALDDDRHTWYTGGFGWDGVRVEAELRADARSPAEASISVLARVHEPSETYYELRLVQIHDTRASDNRLQSQLWRYKNGIPTLLQSTSTTAISGQLTQYHTMVLRVETTGSGILLNGTHNGTLRHTFTDSFANGIMDTGTIGFHARDAVVAVNSVSVENLGGSSLLDTTFTGGSGGTMSDWAGRGARPDDPSQTRWSIVNDHLTRLLPTQNVSVRTAPRVGDAPPTNPADWDVRQSVPVNSLEYQETTALLRDWQEMFVGLWMEAGDTPVVLDDIAIDPWRGRTRTFNGWTVSEAWVQQLSPIRNELQLERSRANPDLRQAAMSPLLTNGIGTIEFDYAVSGGNSVMTIERTAVDNPNIWIELDREDLLSGSSGTYYLAPRTNMTGRIRVRHHEDSDTHANLRIRNLVVTDYPLAGDTTWIAYNVMITGPGNPDVIDKLFEPTNFDAKTAFLNNHPTDDTAVGFIGNLDMPYIQSPAVGTGLGEIGFWYRVWNHEDTTPAEIILRKAPHQNVPPENWITITNIMIEAVGGEHDPNFRYFTMEDFDINNKVLRLYVPTNGNQRVAIDNLLITEPVRAGFDIIDVTLDVERDYPQPIVGDTVGVSARLENFRMNPYNIQLRVDYYAGTNVWGRANWPSTNSVPMYPDPVDPRFYQTGTVRIPSFAIDSVVQFAVVATYEYDGPFAEPILQDDFENPQWYDPIDLNAEPSVHNPGGRYPLWSPYYYVFSCPPYSVWINEFNHDTAGFQEDDYEYVELIGPAGVNIGTWKIKLYGTDLEVYDHVTINNPFVLDDVTENGWGYFVWGDPTVSEIGVVHQTFGQEKRNNIRTFGGIHLQRSMGAWEHRIAYGGTVMPGMAAAGFEVLKVVKDDFFEDGPYVLTGGGAGGGTAYGDFSWQAPVTFDIPWSPGAKHPFQNLGTNPYSPGENGNGPPPLASIAIEHLFMDATDVVILATGTNQWTPTLWYRTNLKTGAWEPVQNIDSQYESGLFTITAPRNPEASVMFYRVSAESEE